MEELFFRGVVEFEDLETGRITPPDDSLGEVDEYFRAYFDRAASSELKQPIIDVRAAAAAVEAKEELTDAWFWDGASERAQRRGGRGGGRGRGGRGRGRGGGGRGRGGRGFN